MASRESHADAREPYPVAEAAGGDDVAGDGESVLDGSAGQSIEDFLSGEPSDTVPVTSGTYALYRATDGSVVLVLEDQKSGVKKIPVPRAMVSLLASGGRRKFVNPLSMFGGGRG